MGSSGGGGSGNGAATAQAQGQANKETAEAQASLDRYNQVNPFGSLTWSIGAPAVGPDGTVSPEPQWTATQTLTPESQHILNQQLGAASSLSDVLGYRAGLAANVASQPQASMGTGPALSNIQSNINGLTVNPSSVAAGQNIQLSGQTGGLVMPAAQAAAGAAANYGNDVAGVAPIPTPDTNYRDQITNALYAQSRSRLDPQFQQAQSDMEAKLAAQGITHGSQAYERELGNFQRGQNDAYQTAWNNAVNTGITDETAQFGMGLQANQQGMQNAAAKVQTPLSAATGLAGINSGAQANTQQALSGLLGAVGASPVTANNQYGIENTARLQPWTDQNTNLSNLINQFNMIEGGQVSSPQFTQEATGVTVNPTDVAGIMTSANNAQTAQQNALISSGGLLGAAGLMSYFS
jgi:hypothetical protein